MCCPVRHFQNLLLQLQLAGKLLFSDSANGAQCQASHMPLNSVWPKPYSLVGEMSALLGHIVFISESAHIIFTPAAAIWGHSASDCMQQVTKTWFTDIFPWKSGGTSGWGGSLMVLNWSQHLVHLLFCKATERQTEFHFGGKEKQHRWMH